MKTREQYLAAAAEWLEKAEDIEKTPRHHLAKHYAAFASANIAMAEALARDEENVHHYYQYVNVADGSDAARQIAESEAATPVPPFMRDYPDNIMWGTEAVHQMGDVTRPEGGFFCVAGETRFEWIGNWVEGMGLVGVRFPKRTSRPVTPEEREHLARSEVVIL